MLTEDRALVALVASTGIPRAIQACVAEKLDDPTIADDVPQCP